MGKAPAKRRLSLRGFHDKIQEAIWGRLAGGKGAEEGAGDKEAL